MTKYLILVAWFISNSGFCAAEVPQGIPYQAAARKANGQPMINSTVLVRFSILDSVSVGPVVYQETHTVTTNNLGLFTVNVGMGNSQQGVFSAINWGNNFKFLEVEVDTSGLGTNYIIMGTQQMMSVPYALFAGSSFTTTSTQGTDTFYAGNNNFGSIGNWNQGGNFSKTATVDSISNNQYKKKIKVSMRIHGIGYHPQNANSGQCIIAIKDALGNNMLSKFTVSGEVTVAQSVQMDMYNITRDIIVEFIANPSEEYKLFANAWGFNWAYGWNGISIGTPIWEFAY